MYNLFNIYLLFSLYLFIIYCLIIIVYLFYLLNILALLGYSQVVLAALNSAAAFIFLFFYAFLRVSLRGRPSLLD